MRWLLALLALGVGSGVYLYARKKPSGSTATPTTTDTKEVVVVTPPLPAPPAPPMSACELVIDALPDSPFVTADHPSTKAHTIRSFSQDKYTMAYGASAMVEVAVRKLWSDILHQEADGAASSNPALAANLHAAANCVMSNKVSIFELDTGA